MLANTPPEEDKENGIASSCSSQMFKQSKHHDFDNELFRKIKLNNPLERWCSYFNNSQLVPAMYQHDPNSNSNRSAKNESNALEEIDTIYTDTGLPAICTFTASAEALLKFHIEMLTFSFHPSDLFDDINDLSINYTKKKSFLFSNQALNDQFDIRIKTRIAWLLSHLAANGYSVNELKLLKEQALDALDHLMDRTSCILHCH